MYILDILTYASYLALVSDIIFQLLRIYKTKSSYDLSLVGMTIRYVAIVIILFKFYSLSDVPLIVGQGLIVIAFTLYFVLAVYYRRNRAV